MRSWDVIGGSGILHVSKFNVRPGLRRAIARYTFEKRSHVLDPQVRPGFAARFVPHVGENLQPFLPREIPADRLDFGHADAFVALTVKQEHGTIDA